MSISVSFRGQNYIIPELGDTYTQGTVDYLNALSTGAVPFPSTADVDLGASGFGLKLAYAKTRAANPSASGLLRLANGDTVAWRNVGNTADLSLAVDAQNQLTFAGVELSGNPMLEATTAAGQSIPNSTSTIVIYGTSVRDTDSGYNVGTGRYTVPAGKGGDYLIIGSIAWGAGFTGGFSTNIFKNAGQVKTANGNTPGANTTTAVEAIINLAAGDVIDIRVTQISGGAIALQASALTCFFSLKRIPS